MSYFEPTDPSVFKDKVLNWVSRFSPFVFLDSCGYADPYGQYDWIAAAGAVRQYDTWKELREQPVKQWLFGHLSYEAHRQMGIFTDLLQPQETTFPELHFFVPQTVIFRKRGASGIHIQSVDQEATTIREHIEALPEPEHNGLPKAGFRKAFEKEAYCAVVEQLRRHIYEGDCYEINFCNRRDASVPEPLDSMMLFKALRERSPAPFAACYQIDRHWLVSASPERYLALDGDRLVSQPIKGTAPRFADATVDAASRETLQHSAKEQAENVMIVDLTRSDWAKVCRLGSVQIAELFGIQAFPQVYQLVSTVSGTLLSQKTLWNAIEQSFPMGSMTGAPRQKVMDLIRQYEQQERGPFSGTLGFVDPDGHADFNVVIRSVWGDDSGRVAFNTGGAITWNSTPQAEWEECLLKGNAIESVFR